jgi:manganese/zinc/iron transport system permease protein
MLITDLYFLKYTLGAALICGLTAIVGVFAYLKKQSLVGDALSHAILPGVCVGFMVSGTKSPVVLLIGALVAGAIALWCIGAIERFTKIKMDASIAIVMVVFFAFGAVLLSYIQQNGNGQQTGLEHFLFGQIASITMVDLKIYGCFGSVLFLFLILFYRANKWVLFDRNHAAVLGLKIGFMDALLAMITVVGVAIGVQSVGIVLISALLLTPAAAARFWTHKLNKIFMFSLLFGILAGVFGVTISFAAPSMPTGPWIVIFLFVVMLGALIFAPNGLLKRYLKSKKFDKKIRNENILKLLFQAKEREVESLSVLDILNLRHFDTIPLSNGLLDLVQQSYLLKTNDSYKLSLSGEVEAARIVRLHRLWEIYLQEKLNIKTDHLHPSAESMEHIITPELEIELLKELNFPTEDPHNKQIPY